MFDNFKIIKDDSYGATSTIFKYKPGKLLKIFQEPLQNFRFNTLSFINKLRTKVSAKIHNYVSIEGERIGYVVDEMPGRNLLKIPINTNVRKFINSIKDVEDDVILLSKNNILTDDLKPANLMYDIMSNKSGIIDQDLYLRLKDESRELIQYTNLVTLYLSVLETIISPIRSDIDQEFYDYLVGIIINSFDFTIPIDIFYDYILNEIEGYYDKEVKSIGDIRKLFKSM